MRDSGRIQKVEAVVVTHRDFGEADRILKAFTRELGKVTILAKGARKSGSRKAPHIEPFTHSSLVLAKGQNFWILTQAESKNAFEGIHSNLQKTGLSAYILELADQLTVEDQPDTQVYRTIVDALYQIESQTDPYVPAYYFEIRLLDIAGFRPDLFRCVGCGKTIIQEDQYFSVTQGGIICPLCGQLGQNLLPVSHQTLKYLRFFQRSHYQKVKNLALPLSVKDEIRKIIDPYVSNITERKLNSPEFIRQMNHQADG